LQSYSKTDANETAYSLQNRLQPKTTINKLILWSDNSIRRTTAREEGKRATKENASYWRRTKSILNTLNSKKWHRKEQAGVDENGNLPTKGRIQQQVREPRPAATRFIKEINHSLSPLFIWLPLINLHLP